MNDLYTYVYIADWENRTGESRTFGLASYLRLSKFLVMEKIVESLIIGVDFAQP